MINNLQTTEQNKKTNKSLRILADVPPMPTKERLEKYKEAGFTHYVMTEDYIKFRTADGKSITDEYFEALDLAHKVGLKTIMRTMRDDPGYFDGFTNELKSRADGYYLCDEPSYEELDWEYESATIAQLPKIVEWYNNYGNNTFFHINLLQSYGVKMLHGLKYTYEEYLRYYIDTVLVNVKGTKTLSTDHYPLAEEDGKRYLKSLYLYDFLLIATLAKELIEKGHDVERGYCVQACKMEGLKCREIESTADIRFQINVALACGAKQLEYYLYSGHGTGIFPDMETQNEYSKTYDYVKEANSEIHNLGNIITDFEWSGVKTFNVGAEELDAFSAAKSLTLDKFKGLEEFTSTENAIVGEFFKDGVYGYMAVNYTEPSFNKNNLVTFTMKDVEKVMLVHAGNVSEINTTNGKVTVELKEGEGVFICPIK